MKIVVFWVCFFGPNGSYKPCEILKARNMGLELTEIWQASMNCQNDATILTPNIAATKLREIWSKTSYGLDDIGPGSGHKA